MTPWAVNFARPLFSRVCPFQIFAYFNTTSATKSVHFPGHKALRLSNKRGKPAKRLRIQLADATQKIAHAETVRPERQPRSRYVCPFAPFSTHAINLIMICCPTFIIPQTADHALRLVIPGASARIPSCLLTMPFFQPRCAISACVLAMTR